MRIWMRSRRTSIWRRAIGAIGALSLVFIASCFCGDPVPRMRGCRGPAEDFSGIADVQIVNAGVVMGFQGGSHFQFQIEATGTGLPTCVAQRSAIYSGGTLINQVDAPVSADVMGERMITSPILHYQYTTSGELVVETLGRRLSTPITASTPPRDGGRSDSGPSDSDSGPSDSDSGQSGADAG